MSPRVQEVPKNFQEVPRRVSTSPRCPKTSQVPQEVSGPSPQPHLVDEGGEFIVEGLDLLLLLPAQLLQLGIHGHVQGCQEAPVDGDGRDAPGMPRGTPETPGAPPEPPVRAESRGRAHPERRSRREGAGRERTSRNGRTAPERLPGDGDRHRAGEDGRGKKRSWRELGKVREVGKEGGPRMRRLEKVGSRLGVGKGDWREFGRGLGKVGIQGWGKAEEDEEGEEGWKDAAVRTGSVLS